MSTIYWHDAPEGQRPHEEPLYLNEGDEVWVKRYVPGEERPKHATRVTVKDAAGDMAYVEGPHFKGWVRLSDCRISPGAADAQRAVIREITAEFSQLAARPRRHAKARRT